MNEYSPNLQGIVYGILYGMGAPSLSEILKVSLGEAATFIETFLGKVHMNFMI